MDGNKSSLQSHDYSEERLNRIEIKLAYLEDFLERLQAEILERNAIHDRLAAEHAAMKEKLLAVSREVEEIPNRRPPHY